MPHTCPLGAEELRGGRDLIERKMGQIVLFRLEGGQRCYENAYLISLLRTIEEWVGDPDTDMCKFEPPAQKGRWAGRISVVVDETPRGRTILYKEKVGT